MDTAVKANYLFSMFDILDFSQLFCSCLLCSSDNQSVMKCTYQHFLPNMPGHHQYLGNTAVQCSKWSHWPQQMSGAKMMWHLHWQCHSTVQSAVMTTPVQNNDRRSKKQQSSEQALQPHQMAGAGLHRSYARPLDNMNGPRG